MIIKLAILVSAIAIVLSISVGLGTVTTAGNSVPVSVASLSTHTVLPSELAPAECSGLRLDRLIVGGTAVKGGRSNDLLIADDRSSFLIGLNGADCLIASSDFVGVLDGGRHTDICIGGTQTLFRKCEVEIVR